LQSNCAAYFMVPFPCPALTFRHAIQAADFEHLPGA
jgi:hypothetical protein